MLDFPFSFLPCRPLLEERVVVEQNPDVVENLVELARGGVKNEVGRDADLENEILISKGVSFLEKNPFFRHLLRVR